MKNSINEEEELKFEKLQSRFSSDYLYIPSQKKNTNSPDNTSHISSDLDFYYKNLIFSPNSSEISEKDLKRHLLFVYKGVQYCKFELKDPSA